MIHPKRKLLMIPGPTNIPDRIASAMLKPMVNHRGETFEKLLEEITEKSKYLFQTKEDVVTITASGTGGVEAAVLNVIRPGDKAVVPVCGDFGNRLSEVIEIAGGTTIRVGADPGSVPPLDRVKEAIEATKDLKAVFLVHNETSTGCALPYVEEVARIANARGVFVIVDAVSSLGGYSIPVDRWGIDICVTASQKCLAAPPGLSLISVSRELQEWLKKSPPKTRYFDLARQLHFLSRGETPFTPAVSLYYALDEALSMLIEEGLEKRVERHARLASSFYRMIGAMGVDLFAKQEVRSNTVIAAHYPEGIEDKPFRKAMSEDHDVVIAGGFAELSGKIFRIGSMGEVSEGHVLRTITALAMTFTKFGREVDLGKILTASKETGN